MSAHPHAALMAEYAKDAAETDKPWERWEASIAGEWHPLACHPEWLHEVRYRRKPRTIRIGQFDVPEPMREAPKAGAFYFTALVDLKGFSDRYIWRDDSDDFRYLTRGLCHATREAAELHARALISLTAEGGE